MNAETNMLRRVFSDACVVDIDMSRWAEEMSIWVWADHYRHWRDSCPLVVVRFRGVTELKLHVSPLEGYPPHRRQWNIDQMRLRSRGRDRRVLELGKLGDDPSIVVTYATVTAREVRKADLGSLFPGWGRADGRLKRPGLPWFIVGRGKRVEKRKR